MPRLDNAFMQGTEGVVCHKPLPCLFLCGSITHHFPTLTATDDRVASDGQLISVAAFYIKFYEFEIDQKVFRTTKQRCRQ